jgi:hypothetical protein
MAWIYEVRRLSMTLPDTTGLPPSAASPWSKERFINNYPQTPIQQDALLGYILKK